MRYRYISAGIGPTVQLDQIERRLKLRELRILLAVVQAGSMAKGAAELGMSQPNVSKAIADLEHAFGLQLLDRSTRGVEPTTYGLAVIKRGVAVFDELRHALTDVAFLADPTSGELRLGCNDWAAGSVGLAIDRMSRRYPRVTFDVLASDAATLGRELKGRSIELVVAMRMGPLDQDDFDAEVLDDDDPLVVAADAQHPLARRRNIELAELMSEAWVMPPADSIPTLEIRDALKRKGLTLSSTVVSTYSSVLRYNLVASARFITVLPKSMLGVMGKSHALKALPVHLPTRQRTIAILVLKKRMLSPIAKLFIETVRSVAKPRTKSASCPGGLFHPAGVRNP
jgi:DNA-binding transcriptional LysR family regulator